MLVFLTKGRKSLKFGKGGNAGTAKQIVILNNRFFLQPEGMSFLPSHFYLSAGWPQLCWNRKKNWIKFLELFCEKLFCSVTKYSVGLNHGISVRWDFAFSLRILFSSYMLLALARIPTCAFPKTAFTWILNYEGIRLCMFVAHLLAVCLWFWKDF